MQTHEFYTLLDKLAEEQGKELTPLQREKWYYWMRSNGFLELEPENRSLEQIQTERQHLKGVSNFAQSVIRLLKQQEPTTNPEEWLSTHDLELPDDESCK